MYRRDHRRRAMRRGADSDAPGPEGLSGLVDRQGHFSERHHLDAHHLAAWRRDHGPLGTARSTGCDRLPAGRPQPDL